MVRNADDLARIDPKIQAARIAHAVGMKKRAEISLRAGERHIYIVNPLPEEKPSEEEKEAEEEAVVEEEKEESEKAEETTKTSELEARTKREKGKESSEQEEKS